METLEISKAGTNVLRAFPWSLGQGALKV